MPIPSGYAAECCLCQRYFGTKAELDAHDLVYQEDHAAALSKGSRAQALGKSFNPDPLVGIILGPDSLTGVEQELRNYAFQKAAVDDTAVTPLDKIFDEDAKQAHSLGKAATPVGTRSLSGIDPQFRHLVRVFGDEFTDQILAKGIEAAPLPTAVGVIPNKRPAGSTPTSRKQEIRNLLEQSLSQLNYNEEVMSSLVEAIAAYTENAIRE